MTLWADLKSDDVRRQVIAAITVAIFLGATTMVGVGVRRLWTRVSATARSRAPAEAKSTVTAPSAIAAPQAVAPQPMTDFVDISFAEINRAIKDAPPLHQEEVARRYQGMRVKWVLSLFTATRRGDDRVMLHLDVHPDRAWAVMCEVLKSEYTWLGILHRGAPITVEGRIADAALATILLDEVKLSFPPRVEPNSPAATSPMPAPQPGPKANAGCLADDIPLPDLHAATKSEIETKLHLARAYIDMGAPKDARSILTEIMGEGSAEQKREAKRLIETLPK
jgi:FimV-like protein